MSVRCGRWARVRGEARGFTLTELMVVVVITGVLAALAFASLRKQVNAAWHAEGSAMVQSIRAAQERWRSEHMLYLDVSTPDAWYPANPRADHEAMHPFYFATPGGHIDQLEWLALRPAAPGPVRFGYLVNAGPGGTPMTVPSAPGTPVTWPANNNDWYVIQAIGETDGDGDCIYMRTSSLQQNIYVVDND